MISLRIYLCYFTSRTLKTSFFLKFICDENNYADDMM